MRRRELLTLLCGGGAGIFGLQIEASAQTPTTARRVAFVVSTGPVNQREHEFFRAFVDELRNLGYVEGRHLTLEGYSGEGRFDRLAELARSIVETGPEVIVAATDPVARAFNEATATIPLVVACSDPVALGFAQSMARPGGNITGIAVYAGPVILEKYVEIIREIDPRILRIGVLAQKLFVGEAPRVVAIAAATMVAEATACRWQWAPSVLLPSELQQRAATTATDIPLTAIQPTDILPAILTSRHARPDVRLRSGRPVPQYAGFEGCAGWLAPSLMHRRRAIETLSPTWAWTCTKIRSRSRLPRRAGWVRCVSMARLPPVRSSVDYCRRTHYSSVCSSRTIL